MKSFLLLVLTIIGVIIVWKVVIGFLLGAVIGAVLWLIHIAMIALVCYLIYAAIKALTRQKQVL